MPARSPFLTFQFLRAWWPTLGAPGEWPHGTPEIVTVYDDGTLIGLVPCFRTVNHAGEPVLAMIGSDVLTDSLGPSLNPLMLRQCSASRCSGYNAIRIGLWSIGTTCQTTPCPWRSCPASHRSSDSWWIAK